MFVLKRLQVTAEQALPLLRGSAGLFRTTAEHPTSTARRSVATGCSPLQAHV